jgi:predicted HTH domain antitoxin
MEEIVSYSFAVQIYKNDSGTYTYGVFQELESETEELELQLLEAGEADTLAEAAEIAGRSIKTLFVV